MTDTPPGAARYRWFSAGDLNGFMALAIDNLALLAGMSAILMGAFHLPSSLVLGRMLPGSALGVLVGDLAYSAMAIQLARRTGSRTVCAMPLGIDTPSMFGLCFGVIGPAWLATRDADRTLLIASAVLAVMGLVKIAAAFLAEIVRRSLPRSAMLSALSAVAIALICFFSIGKIFAEPLGGLVALGVVLSTLVAGRRLPWRIPAMVPAIALGLGAWALGQWALGAGSTASGGDLPSIGWVPPMPSLAWTGNLGQTLPYLPLALPFALVTLVGGIDNTESAAAAGDHYDARGILLVEGIATLAAALFGGVLQNTPYIGHPAYKRMGCRAGYTVATGLFIGLGACTGVVGVLVARLPEAILVPIIVFVGLEMSTQAFRETDPRHLPAVAFAFLPAIADLVFVQSNNLLGVLGLAPESLPPPQLAGYRVLAMMANGFIITSMLWSTLLVDIIDGRRTRILAVCGLAAVLTLFGVIHSPFPDGHLVVPGAGLAPATWLLAAGYVLLGAVTWSIDRFEPHC